MQKVQTISYSRASLFSFGLLILLICGFYRTYIVFFPSFEGYQFVHHFHGAMMLIWIGCLIVQPLLISNNQHRIHKAIGKMSFILAPILMFSIFLVSKATFHSNLNALPTVKDAVAIISLSIPAVIIFGIMYGLAVSNKHRTYYHMRYMIGTGLLMIGPGLGRLLIVNFQFPPPTGISITLAVNALIAVIFLIGDIVHKRDYSPNLIVAGLLVLQSVIWEMRYSAVWQGPGSSFADVFF